MGTKRVGWARIKSLINENQNEIKIRNKDILAVSAAKTLTAGDSGATVYLTKNGSGFNITLPDAEVGMSFKFVIAAGGAANHYILTAKVADKVMGKSTVTTTNATTDTAVQEILKVAGKNKVHLKSDAATTGGRVGDVVELVCVEAGYWLCDARLYTSATPPASITTIQD
tara:strand:+ start:1076 stop:1585 length:510 start_codon:yes stop_codon:yes gene_type:complete